MDWQKYTTVGRISQYAKWFKLRGFEGRSTIWRYWKRKVRDPDGRM